MPEDVSKVAAVESSPARQTRSSTHSPASTLPVLSQRHSPIGAEISEAESDPADKPSDSQEDLVPDDFDDEDGWGDDWGDEEIDPQLGADASEDPKPENLPLDLQEEVSAILELPAFSASKIPEVLRKPPPIADIDQLDIKVSKPKKTTNSDFEDDFFADMAPVIPKSGKSLLEKQVEEATKTSAKFDAGDDFGDGDGWGDDDGAWGDDTDEIILQD